MKLNFKIRTPKLGHYTMRIPIHHNQQPNQTASGQRFSCQWILKIRKVMNKIRTRNGERELVRLFTKYLHTK